MVTCGLSLRVWRVGLSLEGLEGEKTRIAQAGLGTMRGEGCGGHGNEKQRPS